MKKIILLIFLLINVFSLKSQVFTPQEMPSISGTHKGISDPGHFLTPSQASDLSLRLESLDQSTTAGGAIAIVPSIGDMEINQFSTELFERWKLGKDKNDNGFLIVVALEQRRAFICTGYGMEGILPDILCTKIVKQYFIPRMRDGDLYGGLTSMLNAITEIINNPDNKSEVFAGEGSVPQTLSSGEVMEILGYIAVTIFLLTLLIFIMDIKGGRKKNNYEKAMIWRKHIPLYIGCTIFSCGTGLPFLLLAIWFYRHNRNKRMKCDTCGAKMNKLNEEEDNSMLSDSQDLEERLNTVDYDVWVCPECGTVERFPFKIKQSQYSECPNCHTIAQHVVCDKIILAPTTRQPGVGQRDYKCEYCGNHHSTRYRIEKKDDGAAAAILMGAALGAASRGGGGGGGWSGPSGGGSTGGGGGGAGW